MENLKQDITNAAAALFKKCGLRSVSIDDVCKELHISKKTFYNYFKQKDELIEQVLLCIHEHKQAKTKQPWTYDSNKNIIDILMDFDKEIRNNAEDEKKHFSMIFDLEKYYPKIFQKREDAMKTHNLEIIKALINKGLEENIFREDVDIELTAMFLSMQFRTLLELTMKNNKNVQGKIFAFFIDVIIRLLANEKGMAYYLKNYYKA